MLATTSSADDQGFQEFYKQLINLSQFQPKRWFITGSSVEIERCHIGMQLAGLSDEDSDVDQMWYSINKYVFLHERLVPDAYTGHVIRYDTAGMHAGYAKLVKDVDGTKVVGLNQYMQEMDSEALCKGPAMRDHLAADLLEDVKLSGLADVAAMDGYTAKQDLVQAYHCPYWPKEASEWISRPRHHGRPSKSVMKQVISYGCDFVCVAHKSSPNRDDYDEWRFSFSKAELIIIKNWTAKQRIVYRALRVILKKMQQDLQEQEAELNVCTYYFKTLMLYACEDETEEFWADALVDVAHKLLLRLCDQLESRCLPNYFIPSNNMIDHLTEAEIARVVVLIEYVCVSDVVATVIQQCTPEREESYSQTSVQVDLPAWLNTTLVLTDHLQNWDDSFKNLFSDVFSQDLQDAAYAELSDIYQALHYHKLSIATNTASEREECRRRAREHFSAAATYCKSRSLIRADGGFDETVPAECFIAYNCDHARTSRDTRDEESAELWSSVKDLALVQHYTYPDEMYERVCFVAVAGRSLTVNMSWFISQAYFANFLFTALGDYEETVKVCDDVIIEFERSKDNRGNVEYAFHVALSTQWTQIYDEDIQALLGFYSLCMFLSKKSNEPPLVYLMICPVQFVLYLMLRCVVVQKQSVAERTACIERYIEHAEKGCMHERFLTENCKIIFNIIMHVSSRKYYV